METPNADNLDVTCPHCQARLRIDPASGDVVWSRKGIVKGDIETFEQALDVARSRETRHTTLFEEAIAQEKKRQALLERKFQQAQELVDPDEPPPKPFDFD